jgi:hypothetical protein
VGLRSDHFRGNDRLQSCLVQDSSHVTPGDQGEHVSLIQFALMRLLVADLPDDEIGRKIYGRATAAAVLKFKKALDIVNRSYQRSADNIVGKMTIKSLDDHMFVLEGHPGLPPQPSSPLPHPQPPPLPAGARVRVGVTPARSELASPGTLVGDGSPDDPFEGSLATLPEDIQKVVRASNKAKVPADLMLFPFIANHETPLSAKELSKRFDVEVNARERLLAIYTRMLPFGIFAHIKFMRNNYPGTGSKGFFCEPVDHNAFRQLMLSLCRPKVERGTVLRDSVFCQDAVNFHGERDTFREMVKSGPGLHICVTKQGHINDLPCDCHIDEIQQGSVCFNGFCVPTVNKQTVEHVRTVGPWLRQEAEKKVVDWSKKFGPLLR